MNILSKTYLIAVLLMLGFGARGMAQGRGFNLIVVGDPQPQTEEQLSRLEHDIIPRIRSVVEEYRTTSTLPIAILLTGDVVWDTMEFLPRVKSMFEELGVPLYAVIGNHDHDRNVVADEPRAESCYVATFGERYYTFELGDTRFFALDNIAYNSYDDYSIDISKEQLRWLRKLVHKTPFAKRIAVAMHAPLVDYRSGEPLPYARKLLRLFRNRTVHFITGHRHRHATADIRPNAIEHSVAQVSGNLWFAPICADGTPQGVFCIEERDFDWQWHHRILDEDADHRLVVWGEGEVAQNEEYVVVKVIGWDDKWRVEWMENGENMGAMEQIMMVDTDYLDYVDNVADYDDVIMARLRRSALPAHHYFRCRRSSQNSNITIVATDRFGRRFSVHVPPLSE